MLLLANLGRAEIAAKFQRGKWCLTSNLVVEKLSRSLLEILHPGGNRKCKRMLVSDLSSPRVQKLASGRQMKPKCNTRRSSQLLTCCYPSIPIRRTVQALADHHI